MAMLQSCGASFHVRSGFFYFWSRVRPESPSPPSPAFFVLSPRPNTFAPPDYDRG
jgi:hypothetical protein